MLWEIGGHTLQDMISCPLPKIMNNIITAFCIMVLWKKTYWSNLHNPKSIIKGSFVTLLVFAEYVELFCRFYFKFAFWLRVLLFYQNCNGFHTLNAQLKGYYFNLFFLSPYISWSRKCKLNWKKNQIYF